MTMYPMPRKGAENNARELLLGLGMGDYNATIAVQYVMMAPAATDPAMPSVVLMTKHLQQGLRAAGATGVAVTGQMDDATAMALEDLVGPQWNQISWYSLLGSTLVAKRGKVLADNSAIAATAANSVPAAAPLADFLPGLPDVPGGTMTYLVGAAALAYYFLIYKKKGR